MVNFKKNTETAKEFRQSAQSPIPEYVYVYNHTSDHVEVRFENVTIKTPQGDEVLIEDINFTLKDGQRAGLTGPNGGGKSSIFRTMGELTHSGKGRIHITLPEGKRMANVSQEMRKTPTTLPGLMSYPHDPSTYTHEQYEDCLDEAGLPKLKVQLPWNAAKPEVLFDMFKEALDNEIRKHARCITAETAKKVTKAFIKALDTKIEVPDTIARYFTPEYEDTLKQKTIAYAQEKLQNSIAEQEGKKLIFPGFTGRKIARNTLNNGQNKMQNWLFQGHKMPLSGGQAEQLGFARLFLQADEISLFLLDEVSSALKEEKADELYNKLFEKAKGATAIGIIHNNNLLKHYTHHLELDDHKHVTLKQLDQSGNEPPPQTPEI